MSDGNIVPPQPDGWDGWLSAVSHKFDAEVSSLNEKLEEALNALEGNPSDPSVLARYQSRLSEYTLYRNAQSNTVKAFKDTSAAIIQNFR